MYDIAAASRKLYDLVVKYKLHATQKRRAERRVDSLLGELEWRRPRSKL